MFLKQQTMRNRLTGSETKSIRAAKIEELNDTSWLNVKDITNISIAKRNRLQDLQTKQWNVC